MFSAEGIAAITLTFGLSSAIARIVARIDAAPPMSDFIHSIPVASLIDRPPESNAMPLPVSAIGEPFPPPEYLSSISRGGRTLPCPTPSTPPNPPFLSSASAQTLQVSPTSLAIACASFASPAGGRSSAGVFTRSRAHICDSAITSPRRIESFAAFASVLPAPEDRDLGQAPGRAVRLGLVAVEPVRAEEHALHRRLDGLELVLRADDLRERGRDRLAPPELSRDPADRPPAGVGARRGLRADADQQDRLGRERLVPGVRHQEGLAALALGAGGRELLEEVDPLHVLHAGSGLGTLEDGQDQDVDGLIRGAVGREGERRHDGLLDGSGTNSAKSTDGGRAAARRGRSAAVSERGR